MPFTDERFTIRRPPALIGLARAFAGGFALALVSGARVSATNGHWQPNDVFASTHTRTAMIEAYERGRGDAISPSGSRTEHYRIDAGTRHLDAIAFISGADFRIVATLPDGTYEMGRSNGIHWRRTASGVTRIVESDFQGDDLDRWPLAAVGPTLDSCDAGGETRGTPALWVLECRPPDGFARWIYFDPATGDVAREVLREGKRVTSFRFDDIASVAGWRRPVTWHVAGAGGSATVTMTSADLASIDPGAVAIPKSVTNIFKLPAPLTPIDAAMEIGSGATTVEATIAGKRARLIIDTGTCQVLLDSGFVARLGLQQTLGHATIPSLRVGNVEATDLSVQTIEFGERNIVGLLGNEFFTGHVVHIDYRGRFDLIAHDAFVPPTGALVVKLDVDEGIPLVDGAIGSITGARFALDTASDDVVIPRHLTDRGNVSSSDLGVTTTGRKRFEGYLEGGIYAHAVQLREIRLGPLRFLDQPGMIEDINAGDSIDIPLDGIFGTRLLAGAEWWFDYDDDRAWVRPY